MDGPLHPRQDGGGGGRRARGVLTAPPSPAAPAPTPAGEDSRKLASGAGFTLFGRVSGQGLQIVIQVLLARLLGPTPFGLYALGWTVFRLARAIGVLGLDKGAVRFGARHWRSDAAALRSLFDRAVVISLAAGCLLGGGLFVAAPHLAAGAFAKPDLAPVLRWFAVALPAVIVLRVVAACTRVSQQTRYSVLSEDLLPPAVHLLFLLVVLPLGWGLTGALIGAALSVYAGAGLSLVWLLRLFPGAYSAPARRRESSRRLLSFSLQASLGSIFAMLVLWIDRLMVGIFRPPADVGVYQAASQISLVFVMVLGSFTTIFSPLVAEIHAGADRRRLEELFRVSTKWGLYLTVPAFLVVVFSPRQVMAATFGAEYVPAALALVVLTAGQMVNAATGSVGQLLVMTGYHRPWFIVSGGMLAVNVALNLLLIPRWGLDGAAWATALSVAALFLAGLWQAKVLLGVFPYDRRYWKLALATAVTAALLALVTRVPFPHPVWALLCSVLLALGGFYGVLRALPFDAEEREVLASLRRRLRWRRSPGS